MLVSYESRKAAANDGGTAVAEAPATGTPERARTTLPPAPEIPAVAATIRWRVPGAAGELRLDACATAPLIVPVHEHGASLAAALVEALDRSVARPHGPLEVRRGLADVSLSRSDWKAPARLPSEILAGQFNELAAGGSPRLLQLRERVGPEAIDRLIAFPARRRALALHRRRLERNFFRHDEDVRSAQRNTLVFGGLAAAGFAATFAGALGDASGLAATGALASALSAGGVFLAVAGRTRHEALREIVRRAMARVVRHEEALEDDANALSRQLESDDPWVLSEELARLEAEPTAVHDRAELVERRRLGLELARRLERGREGLENTSVWNAPRACTSSSWPPDVARHEDEGGDALAIVGMARLLHRVQRDLPQPWPIVLWEPWVGAAPEVRAERLGALTALAGGRPVVAFVRA